MQACAGRLPMARQCQGAKNQDDAALIDQPKCIRCECSRASCRVCICSGLWITECPASGANQMLYLTLVFASPSEAPLQHIRAGHRMQLSAHPSPQWEWMGQHPQGLLSLAIKPYAQVPSPSHPLMMVGGPHLLQPCKTLLASQRGHVPVAWMLNCVVLKLVGAFLTWSSCHKFKHW